MIRKTHWAAAAMLALVGCTTDDQNQGGVDTPTVSGGATTGTTNTPQTGDVTGGGTGAAGTPDLTPSSGTDAPTGKVDRPFGNQQADTPSAGGPVPKADEPPAGDAGTTGNTSGGGTTPPVVDTPKEPSSDPGSQGTEKKDAPAPKG